DPNGGKNFFVYGESFNGTPMQCFAGENAAQAVGGGVTLTYPGITQLPAANCQVTTGRNGTITIDVPLSNVNEPGAIDNRLHEVTARHDDASGACQHRPSGRWHWRLAVQPD